MVGMYCIICFFFSIFNSVIISENMNDYFSHISSLIIIYIRMKTTGIPTKQRVQQVIEEVEKNDNFFASQSRDQLMNIKFAMEKEAQRQKDPEKKGEMQLYARQAQEMINFKQNKEKERRERISLVQQIKQGAKDISATQEIIMGIVVLIAGLLAYFQNNQKEGWFTTTVIVCFFVFLGMLIGIIAYNCFCRRNIEQQRYADINDDEKVLNSQTEK